MLNLLKKTKKWMTAKEIAKSLDCSKGNVTRALGKMVGRDVLRKEGLINEKYSVYLWKYKD